MCWVETRIVDTEAGARGRTRSQMTWAEEPRVDTVSREASLRWH